MSQPGQRPPGRHLTPSESLTPAPGESPRTPATPRLAGGATTSLEAYLRSATTLRDIHSLKLSRTRQWADWLKFGLIALSTVATCVGFIGIDDIADDVGISEGLVNFIFNVVLLLLLLIVIWDLAWRQGDRSHEHQRALVVLTDFIRDIENQLRQPIEEHDIDLVGRFGERHELIIEILPPHTDADYLASKRAAAKKELNKAAIKKETEEGLARIAAGTARQSRLPWR